MGSSALRDLYIERRRIIHREDTQHSSEFARFFSGSAEVNIIIRYGNNGQFK
jgi:hypothetical protein